MKEWVEGLLPLERDLFFALNGSESVFLDNVMWTISGRLIWIPLYLLILILIFYKTPRKEAFLVTLFFILVFVVCDQVSSSLFKPLFERFRPTHHPDFEEMVDTVNNYRGGRYGFISGHATNSFGLAVFISLLFARRVLTVVSLFWATLNSYTRIYLGVHFISDILAGMIVGSLLALGIYIVYIQIRKRIKLADFSSTGVKSVYSGKHATFLACFIIIYLGVITVFSSLLATLPH